MRCKGDGVCALADASGTDEDLARGARRGCVPCFESLLGRYEARVYNFIRRTTPDRQDAEDLTQETFVHAWRGIGRYDDRWRFSTWLFTIATRRAATHRRRRAGPLRLTDWTAGGTADALAGGEDWTEAPDERSEDLELGRRLWAAAETVLSSEARSALWLRYVEDMSAKDIASIIGKSPVAVRVMLFRAREKLARWAREEAAPAAGHPPEPAQTPPGHTSAWAIAREAGGGAEVSYAG
jgi:RNA polymerase sigma-70 factor, ECF subfamily